MSALRYKSHAQIEDLAVGECTVHRCSGSAAARWWLLWFRVLRDDYGQPADFCVPVNPGGGYIEQGPGGKTWGLTCPAGTYRPGTTDWQISPSINVLASGDAHAGAHPDPSQWHQTPAILNVPDDEPWACGAAP